jgi:amidophosphoribosyltransferase
MIHMLADPKYSRNPQRVGLALAELKGAFAFLLMTKSAVMAARDPHGFRPLSIGRIGTGWAFASETCALRQTGAEYVRDLEPGELVTVDQAGMRSERFAERSPKLAQCVFEMVYFARPDSVVFGENVHGVRVKYGVSLAREFPVDADIVIPVPDSGNSAALGYSRESGIPLDYGFIRNHYIGRTFIMPDQNDRAAGVDMKLSVMPEVVKGKRVVIVDDSIVRGTTARKRVHSLKAAGATEVHVRISCPPVSHPCFFGIDFPTRQELIAGHRSVEDTRKYLGADSLGYLSTDLLLAPFKNNEDFCAACFTGKYKVEVDEQRSKNMLETHSQHLQLDL